MSIQDWGAVGELVGAIAVIVTLLYLATQIRQQTRGLRNAASVSINEAMSQINGRLAENQNGFTEIWVRGCADLGSLDPVELERWQSQTFDFINLAILVDQMEQDDLADVHSDYLGYLTGLIHANPGLAKFMADMEPLWPASEQLYVRLTGEPDIKHTSGPGTSVAGGTEG